MRMLFVKTWRFLIIFQKAVMIFASLSLATMVSITVFLRYMFKMDLYGIEEIEIVVAMWLYFIGAAFGSYSRNQIKADIVEALIPENQLKRTIRCVRSFLSVILYGGITLLGFDAFLFSLSSGIKTSIWKIPTYFLASGVLLGLALMTMYGIAEMKDDIQGLFLSKMTTSEESPCSKC